MNKAQHDHIDFDDAALIVMCQEFLKQERLMAIWHASDGGLDEGFAAAASDRWQDLGCVTESAEPQIDDGGGQVGKVHPTAARFVAAAPSSCWLWDEDGHGRLHGGRSTGVITQPSQHR